MIVAAEGMLERSELARDLQFLCRPPAASWAASSSGWAPLGASCHMRRFNTTVPSEVSSRHWRSVEAELPSATAAVIGVPFDGGSLDFVEPHRGRRA